MPISNNIKDREFGKFCENSLGKPAVDICIDPAQLAQIGDGGALKSADAYSNVLFGFEDYNSYIVEDDQPTEYTVYYFNYGVEQFHMTIIPDQTGKSTVMKLSPKQELTDLRYALSLVSSTDIAGKTVAILNAIGNVNKDTTFSLISDPSGFFTIDTINNPNTVQLLAPAPANTYNITVRATGGAVNIDRVISVVVT